MQFARKPTFIKIKSIFAKRQSFRNEEIENPEDRKQKRLILNEGDFRTFVLIDIDR